MPVKVRCSGCEKVLNAPDQARGKAIRCPGCGEKIKVPGGTSSPAGGSPPGGKATGGKATGGSAARKPKRELSSEDYLANLDFEREGIEHSESKVCPYCAAEMDLEEVVCTACGMNVETGKMDAKEEKRLTRKGLDPAKFYAKAWSDSWKFLTENLSLAYRTGSYFLIFAFLNSICGFMLGYCTNVPPMMFWFGMTLLTSMGIPGWYWFLSMKIVSATVTRDQLQPDRIHFDFFQCVALGFRGLFWPAIVMLPFLPVLVWVGLGLGVFAAVAEARNERQAQVAAAAEPQEQQAVEMSQSEARQKAIDEFAQFFIAVARGLLYGAVIVFAMCSVAYLFFPLAMVHMTAKYTYKSWILWELLKVFVRNVGPCLYWHVMAFVMVLPVLLIAAPIWYFLFKSPNPFLSPIINGWSAAATDWFLRMVGEQPTPDGWMFTAIKILLNLILVFLFLAPVYLAAGFPAVFLMRANGLLGLYNKNRLGLVNRMEANTTATFWVRVLAHIVDEMLTPLTSLLVMKEKRALMIAWGLNAINFLIIVFSPHLIVIGGAMWSVYMYWMYYAVSEASATKNTLGKDAFGLIVLNEQNRQLTLKEASIRHFGRLICNIGGIGYLVAAFHPEKKSVADLISKTRVVFRGDH